MAANAVADADQAVEVAVEGVTKSFGGVTALQAVTLSLKQREIVGVIGPNGAGKSTLFNMVSGFLRPTSGRISLSGVDLVGMPPHRVARLGLVKTFQDARLFAGERLSVLDNVLIGTLQHQRTGLLGAGVRSPGFRAEQSAAVDRAHRLLDMIGIGALASGDPASLSYGERRLVEIARALAADPKILLLDEPTAGLNAAETARLAAVLRQVHEAGVGIAVVDHDIPFIMGLVQHVVVLAVGEVIAEGAPEVVRNDEGVREAYFGRAR